MAQELERRAIGESVALRATVANPVVSGYAALFNTETVIAGLFRETIDPGAFDAAVNGEDDVRALFNHDANIVLGRNKAGTLTLTEDKKGLRYEIDLNPDDPEAMSVRAKIKRGDVSGSSFGFVVEEDEWVYPKNQRDMPLRTIKSVSLFDVSPVTYPAYPQTSVSARAKAEATVAEAAAILAAAEAEATRVGLAARDAARAAIDRAKQWQASS